MWAPRGPTSPFSYQDPDDQLTGYDVEVARAVGAKLGKQAEFVEAPWDAIFAGLQADRFDVVANQVTKNAEREARYALSEPYTFSDGVIVTRADDNSITLARQPGGQDHGPERPPATGPGGHATPGRTSRRSRVSPRP